MAGTNLMAKDELTPTERPDVVAALNLVYPKLLQAFEQFHRQEHRFQIKYRYGKLQKRFDRLVHCARGWRRCVLNRIERLGGDADSTIGPVEVADEVGPAYRNTHDLLSSIYDAIGAAIAVVQSQNDHPTHKVLMTLQQEVDHKRAKLEAWLRQVADLGDQYILTVV
jgi:hypothetical protein